MAGSKRFNPAFARSLPDLPAADLYWRLHFMVGVLAFCMTGTDMMRMIASSRMEGANEGDHLVDRLVSFITQGMNAPALDIPQEEKVSRSA